VPQRIGAFMAVDLILFYIFFELTLVPTYMLIAGWGGARRTQAAMKFFIYTMGGSC
jgi:NADH-quinone oxidoreductase subunit M